MGKDPSKIKRRAECKRMVDATTMRPLSHTPTGGVRVVCLDCFARVMALGNAVRDARGK